MINQSGKTLYKQNARGSVCNRPYSITLMSDVHFDGWAQATDSFFDFFCLTFNLPPFHDFKHVELTRIEIFAIGKKKRFTICYATYRYDCHWICILNPLRRFDEKKMKKCEAARAFISN